MANWHLTQQTLGKHWGSESRKGRQLIRGWWWSQFLLWASGASPTEEKLHCGRIPGSRRAWGVSVPQSCTADWQLLLGVLNLQTLPVLSREGKTLLLESCLWNPANARRLFFWGGGIFRALPTSLYVPGSPFLNSSAHLSLRPWIIKQG